MGEHHALWIDARADRDRARTGDSRFAEVLAENLADFDGVWGDIAPVVFTCTAWRLATPPVSVPGFVRWHRRVLSVTCDRNPWDGSLTARISLVSPLPAELQTSRTWWRDRGWQGWPEVFGQFVEPAAADLTKIPFIRPVLLFDVPVPLDDLPPTPERPDGSLARTAQHALLVVVRELNHLVDPVIALLEGDRSG